MAALLSIALSFGISFHIDSKVVMVFLFPLPFSLFFHPLLILSYIRPILFREYFSSGEQSHLSLGRTVGDIGSKTLSKVAFRAQ